MKSTFSCVMFPMLIAAYAACAPEAPTGADGELVAEPTAGDARDGRTATQQADALTSLAEAAMVAAPTHEELCDVGAMLRGWKRLEPAGAFDATAELVPLDRLAANEAHDAVAAPWADGWREDVHEGATR